jgi:predicted Zn-dependent protease
MVSKSQLSFPGVLPKTMAKYCCFILLLLASFSVRAQDEKSKVNGQRTFEMIKLSSGIYHHPELLSIVTEVGRNLEKHLDLGYELKYFIVDTDAPNAFATAGGYVYVTRGLLANLNNKDELAGVMGHELTHVTERHVPKRSHANIVPAVLEIPANIIGLLTYTEVGKVLNLPIDFVADLALSMYSRSQENEADLLGVQLASKAGYNPNGLVDALNRLNAYVELVSGHEIKNSIFADHPMTENRVENIVALIQKEGLKKNDLDPFTDITALDNLIYGQNPSGGILTKSTFIHPDIGLYCLLPEKWQIGNYVTSVIALSGNSKNQIILSVDSTSDKVQVAAYNSISRLKNCEIIIQDPSDLNGLEAHRVTLKSKKVKYADQRIEMMWLKMPSSNTIIKVVGITHFKHPEPAIGECFNSFRQLTPADVEGKVYKTIKLIPSSEYANIKEYTLQNTDTLEALLEVLNGAGSDESISSGRYMKVLTLNPLKESTQH